MNPWRILMLKRILDNDTVIEKSFLMLLLYPFVSRLEFVRRWVKR